jgi:DNA topoisomerase I
MEKALDDIAEGKVSWEKYLIEWNTGYLDPAVAKARTILADVKRVAGTATGSRPATGNRSPATGYRSEDREQLDKATAKAQKLGAQPSCPKNHGAMLLRFSKKKTFYWKCLFPECDAFAWYQEFSREKCPECTQPLEKIPSKKVTGGYFLKCGRKQAHAAEVVMFRNRKTKEWEIKGQRPGSAPSP